MELDDEVKMLRYMRQDVITAARDMKAALIDLYAPGKSPCPEVLTAVQLLASDEGFHAECPNHACRRTGLCQASDVEPECAPLWPEALRERLDDMLVGIALSAFRTEASRAAIHARLVQAFGPDPAAPSGKKRSRSAAGTPG
ncbi:hypothetical protein ACG873_18180 [Mesorhizobium sp. AaZ16]|uniref:hypothetical protein n=1 Tax=Mesorhizobium sp. AaZ16 TaxID=3402289 RepID=UPI00374E5B8B